MTTCRVFWCLLYFCVRAVWPKNRRSDLVRWMNSSHTIKTTARPTYHTRRIMRNNTCRYIVFYPNTLVSAVRAQPVERGALCPETYNDDTCAWCDTCVMSASEAPDPTGYQYYNYYNIMLVLTKFRTSTLNTAGLVCRRCINTVCYHNDGILYTLD